MSQPQQYNPTTGFQQEETNAVAGRSTVRTAALDAEFSNIKTSINALVTNIGLIQRDDGALKDGSVVLSSFSAAALVLIGSAGFVPRGGWLTATAYAVKDIIETGSPLTPYVCVVAHTSGVFATDYAAGKWMILGSTTSSATNVVVTPTGGIAATNAQSAIAELDSEKARKDANLSDLTDAAVARTNISVPSKAETQNNTQTFVAAGGSADAITGAYSPAVTALTNGMRLAVECVSANTTTTPTFKADGTTAKTIVRPDGSALLVGDVSGANFVAIFSYDQSLDKWLLINPAWSGPAPTVTGRVLTSAGPTVQPVFQDPAAASRAFKNKLINPDGRVYQRAIVATADDTYFADRWYALTQTGTVLPSVLSDPENGFTKGVRITQSQAAAQRFGYAQIIRGRNCKHLRGESGTFVPRIRISNSQAMRYAVLGWTSTEDSVTSDVVADWTSSSYAAAGFFLAANLSVLGVGSSTPSASAWTSLPALSPALGSTFNNIIVFVWTEGTAAQNFTLDFDYNQFESGALATEFERVPFEQTVALCLPYMEKSWAIDTPVGTAANLDAVLLQSVATAAAMANRSRQSIPFKVSKIVQATIAFYDMAGTVGKVTTVSDDTFTNNVTPAVGVYQSGLERFTMQMQGEPGFMFHWTAISEL